MKTTLKIGIALLAFGLALALIGAGLIRSHALHSSSGSAITSEGGQAQAKRAATPPGLPAQGK